MLMPSVAFMTVMISMMILKRQHIHNELASRNEWYHFYDFIIIGSGSAGSIVASRLSELKNINVLLLEVGGPQTIATEMPANSFEFPIETNIDWNYMTVPQKYASFAYTNHQIRQPRGKVLGGSSTNNALIYNRGNRNDYDNWVYTYGAKGWSYNEILPYFLKSENNTDPNIVAKNPEFHSTHGPFVVSTSNDINNYVLNGFIRVANQFGYPSVDVNGPQQYGIGPMQQNIKEGVRQTLANAYLEPDHVRYRNNLHVLAHAFVTKIIIEKTQYGTPIAKGVKFTRNGKQYIVKALKEVIVSAGVFNTPQLLMLSGIGPKNQLKDFNIPLVVDLPVGENFQDHPVVELYYDIIRQESVPSTDLTIENMFQFFYNNNGPLTFDYSPYLYLNADDHQDISWPNGYTYGATLRLPTNLSLTLQPYADKQQWFEFFAPYSGRAYFIHSTTIPRPKSRGTVRLATSNPYDPPLIDPAYLSNHEDIELILRVLKRALQITLSSEFNHYATIYNRSIPGCDPCYNNYFCDSYLICIIKLVTRSDLHPVGTCRMGSSNDPYAVTDERLRVRKVKRLRVIDGSVMPQITSGNSNAPIVMIAEKASDMIKEDWNFIN